MKLVEDRTDAETAQFAITAVAATSVVVIGAAALALGGPATDGQASTRMS